MSLQGFQHQFYLKLRRRDLEVYAGNFVGGVLETLRENFSLARKVLGDSEFELLANQFAAEENFLHWSRYHLGENFPRWFTSRHPDQKLLRSVLQYEWDQHAINLWCENPEPSQNLQKWLCGEKTAGIFLRGCKLSQLSFDLSALIDQGSLRPGESFLLMGIGPDGHFCEIELSSDEFNLCSNLNISLSFEDWLRTIPVGSNLENEAELSTLLQKLIQSGWLAESKP